MTLDHLVVAAASLDAGVQWCEATLGIAPGPGGKHALMGTHNRLFSIAGAAFPQAYFEIIAIDGDAAPPRRARWFGLDELDLRAGPRLLHWVARCSALDARLAALHAAGFDAGAAIAVARDTPRGRLAWRIGVRDDGRLLCGGALPTLIEWGAAHPSDAMPPSGMVLHSLTLRGVPAAAAQALGWPGVEFAANAGPALSATLDTPRGRVTLHSD
ncbi:MAG: VOC family protein [Burkholderiaceae bacterium]|nr:VOC family protein [Burkholderiaceae bacterium]